MIEFQPGQQEHANPAYGTEDFEYEGKTSDNYGDHMGSYDPALAGTGDRRDLYAKVSKTKRFSGPDKSVDSCGVLVEDYLTPVDTKPWHDPETETGKTGGSGVLDRVQPTDKHNQYIEIIDDSKPTKRISSNLYDEIDIYQTRGKIVPQLQIRIGGNLVSMDESDHYAVIQSPENDHYDTIDFNEKNTHTEQNKLKQQVISDSQTVTDLTQTSTITLGGNEYEFVQAQPWTKPEGQVAV